MMLKEYNHIPELQPHRIMKDMDVALAKQSIQLQASFREAEEAKQAIGYHKMLMNYISKFEQSLADDETVAIKLASFGQSITIAVESLGYHNPGTICFYGTCQGNRIQLIQHMHQLNFLLMAEKVSEQVPRIRLGFKPDEL